MEYHIIACIVIIKRQTLIGCVSNLLSLTHRGRAVGRVGTYCCCSGSLESLTRRSLVQLGNGERWGEVIEGGR